MTLQSMICELFQFSTSCANIPMDKLLIEYLLVPSVITILMIYMISAYMLRGVEIGGRMKPLISIVLYIVFVYSGLYAIFAPMFYAYVFFMILIVGGLFLFTRVISRQGWSEIGNTARIYRESKTDLKQIKRAVQIRENERNHFEDMLEKLRKTGKLGVSEESTINMLMHQINAEIDNLRSLEAQIASMGREASTGGGGARFQEMKLAEKNYKDCLRKYEGLKGEFTRMVQYAERNAKMAAMAETEQKQLEEERRRSGR